MSVFAAVGLAGAMVVAVSGAAFAQSKTFEVAPFSGVDISSGLNADITVGPTVSVTAQARDPRDLDDLRVEVRDDRLFARIERSILDLRFGDRRITIHITTPRLDFLQASAGADVTAKGLAGQRTEANASGGADLTVTSVEAGEMVASASSGSDLRLSGTCRSATFDISSGSDLDGRDLKCQDVAIRASSGSDAEVFASKSLVANASSGSDIEVHGNPASVTKDASSGAGIELR